MYGGGTASRIKAQLEIGKKEREKSIYSHTCNAGLARDDESFQTAVPFEHTRVFPFSCDFAKLPRTVMGIYFQLRDSSPREYENEGDRIK